MHSMLPDEPAFLLKRGGLAIGTNLDDTLGCDDRRAEDCDGALGHDGFGGGGAERLG